MGILEDIAKQQAARIAKEKEETLLELGDTKDTTDIDGGIDGDTRTPEEVEADRLDSLSPEEYAKETDKIIDRLKTRKEITIRQPRREDDIQIRVRNRHYRFRKDLSDLKVTDADTKRIDEIGLVNLCLHIHKQLGIQSPKALACDDMKKAIRNWLDTAEDNSKAVANKVETDKLKVKIMPTLKDTE